MKKLLNEFQRRMQFVLLQTQLHDLFFSSVLPMSMSPRKLVLPPPCLRDRSLSKAELAPEATIFGEASLPGPYEADGGPGLPESVYEDLPATESQSTSGTSVAMVTSNTPVMSGEVSGGIWIGHVTLVAITGTSISVPYL